MAQTSQPDTGLFYVRTSFSQKDTATVSFTGVLWGLRAVAYTFSDGEYHFPAAAVTHHFG
jgi:hypothetical protein